MPKQIWYTPVGNLDYADAVIFSICGPEEETEHDLRWKYLNARVALWALEERNAFDRAFAQLLVLR